MGLFILNMATGSAPECITYNGNNAHANLSNANVKYYTGNTTVTALNEFGGTNLPYSKNVPGSVSYYICKPHGESITFKTGYIALNNGSETGGVPQWTMPAVTPPSEGGGCVTGTTTVPVFKNFGRLYSYTKTVQSFTPPMAGYKYKMECWGASGGDATYGSTVKKGGRGGYTKGWIELSSAIPLYIYVGEAGSYIPAVVGNDFNSKEGTYNGGGAAQNHSCVTATGGGATDIRIVKGSDWDDFTSLKSRIMVAAGGGGGNTYSFYSGGNSGDGSGGHAGGQNGGNGTIAYSSLAYTASQVAQMTPSTGGGQNSGGNPLAGSYVSGGVLNSGTFGKGGNAKSGGYRQGGGSGYYGGGSGGAIPSLVFSGAGGSSFISGYTGCNAINYESSTSESNIIHRGSSVLLINAVPYSFASSSSTAPIMTAGNQTMPNPTSAIANESNGHTGNGYARITCTPYD